MIWETFRSGGTKDPKTSAEDLCQELPARLRRPRDFHSQMIPSACSKQPFLEKSEKPKNCQKNRPPKKQDFNSHQKQSFQKGTFSNSLRKQPHPKKHNERDPLTNKKTNKKTVYHTILQSLFCNVGRGSADEKNCLQSLKTMFFFFAAFSLQTVCGLFANTKPMCCKHSCRRLAG